MNRTRKMVAVLLMAMGAVNVSFGLEIPEYFRTKTDAKYVREQVAYMEEIKKEGYGNTRVDNLLKKGKLFLELVEAIEKDNSGEKDCGVVAKKYMADNEDKYYNYSYWVHTGCPEISLKAFKDEIKDMKLSVEFDRAAK